MGTKRKLKTLAGKGVSSKKAGTVKGGFFGGLLKKIKKTV